MGISAIHLLRSSWPTQNRQKRFYGVCVCVCAHTHEHTHKCFFGFVWFKRMEQHEVGWRGSCVEMGREKNMIKLYCMRKLSKWKKEFLKRPEFHCVKLKK